MAKRRRARTIHRMHSSKKSRSYTSPTRSIYTPQINSIFTQWQSPQRTKLKTTNVYSQPNVNQQKKALKSSLRTFGAIQPQNIPKQTICSQRQTRREIMFAGGYGGTQKTKPTFTSKSKVICRRK